LKPPRAYKEQEFSLKRFFDRSRYAVLEAQRSLGSYLAGATLVKKFGSNLKKGERIKKKRLSADLPKIRQRPERKYNRRRDDESILIRRQPHHNDPKKV